LNSFVRAESGSDNETRFQAGISRDRNHGLAIIAMGGVATLQAARSKWLLCLLHAAGAGQDPLPQARSRMVLAIPVVHGEQLCFCMPDGKHRALRNFV
jgi:hypothetical protein